MSIPKDPHQERESQNYENPIASRELILEVLSEADGPMSQKKLAKIFKLTEEDQFEALRRRLNAMVRDGQLLQNRRSAFMPISEADLIRGRISAHPDGFGFLVPDEGGEDLFLSPKQMRSLLHGDRAICRVVGVDRRGRREGSLVEVLERAHTEVVGRYIMEGGMGFVIPDNKKIAQDILIPPEQQGDAEAGLIVVAAIVDQPTKHSQPIGRITSVLGEHMAPGMEIDIAIRNHELPHNWPEAVAEQVKIFGEEVPEESKGGRTDLRDTPLVTIDGEDARDFDDAVYCESTDNGWKLIVAIADVSAYVEVGTPLDQEAQSRGTSVYFPKQVIPMLPEVLSNGLCSINPEVDRLCMCCELNYDSKGNPTGYGFFEGVMRSHARLTYTQVADMVVERDDSQRADYSHVVEHLDDLYELYGLLRKARDKRGAIDFETTETLFVFDEQRKIQNIVPRHRNEAHKIIEECMIAANVAAAKFLKKHKVPSLHRVHDGPKLEKILDLREFLGEFGLHLRGGAEPTPKDYADIMGQIQGRPDEQLIQTVLLRSMSQAQYSPEGEVGHFGLAHTDYAHFTSPIRRYPDLLVHRAIRHIVRGGKPSGFNYTHEQMMTLGEHCSMCERRADDATRDATDWLKCEFMLDKVGHEYTGTVSGVTSFGLFLALDEVFVEGLVHVTSLAHDYYAFDPVGHKLTGKRSNKVYRLGDRVDVIVARVDLDERKIDFEVANMESSELEAPKPKKKKRKKKADSQ